MPEVYGFVYLRCGQNKAITEDLVSEIFLKAVEKFVDFDEKKGSFKTWVFAITRNHLIDHYKSAKNTQTEDLAEIADKEKDHKDTKEIAEKEIEKEKLQAILKKLPPDKQELIALRYYSGYSFKEIERITGEDENKNRVKTHRILKSLKEKLKFLK